MNYLQKSSDFAGDISEEYQLDIDTEDYPIFPASQAHLRPFVVDFPHLFSKFTAMGISLLKSLLLCSFARLPNCRIL